jgi:hypothetical protein
VLLRNGSYRFVPSSSPLETEQLTPVVALAGERVVCSLGEGVVVGWRAETDTYEVALSWGARAFLRPHGIRPCAPLPLDSCTSGGTW